MKSFIIGCVFVLCFIFSLEVYAGNNCEPNGKMNASGTCDCLKGFKNVGGVGKSRCEKEVVKDSEPSKDADKPVKNEEAKKPKEPIAIKLDTETVFQALMIRTSEFDSCLINDARYEPSEERVHIFVSLLVKNGVVIVEFGNSNYTSNDDNKSVNYINFLNCIEGVYSTISFPSNSYYTDKFKQNIMTQEIFIREKERRERKKKGALRRERLEAEKLEAEKARAREAEAKESEAIKEQEDAARRRLGVRRLILEQEKENPTPKEELPSKPSRSFIRPDTRVNIGLAYTAEYYLDNRLRGYFVGLGNADQGPFIFAHNISVPIKINFSNNFGITIAPEFGYFRNGNIELSQIKVSPNVLLNFTSNTKSGVNFVFDIGTSYNYIETSALDDMNTYYSKYVTQKRLILGYKVQTGFNIKSGNVAYSLLVGLNMYGIKLSENWAETYSDVKLGESNMQQYRNLFGYNYNSVYITNQIVFN
jgi:hypothetical protein